AGVIQRTVPPQYEATPVLGVPPCVIRATFDKERFIHSPASQNSGKRSRGTVSPTRGKSCCISHFLWALSAPILSVCAAISSSRDERQSAIFCCSSGRIGTSIGICFSFPSVSFGGAAPVMYGPRFNIVRYDSKSTSFILIGLRTCA